MLRTPYVKFLATPLEPAINVRQHFDKNRTYTLEKSWFRFLYV